MDIVQERGIKGKYQSLDEKKFHGVHYTPDSLADFVASRIISNYSLDKRKDISIFDPAVGNGELLYALARQLLKKNLAIKIFGHDIDKSAITFASRRLASLQGNVEVSLSLQDFTLQGNSKDRKYDLIIANPPYVRTQSLGTMNSTDLSHQYGLEGRIDLYYIFLLGVSQFMKPDSIAGFIVSNRFMTTKSGESVRAGLLNKYELYEVYDFGDTKLFEAAVLPAVLVFSRHKKMELIRFASVYSKKISVSDGIREDDLFKAILGTEGLFKNAGNIYEVKSGFLKASKNHKDIWAVSNNNTDLWLNTVKRHTFCTFQDLGKIRVGVKTTADKIFIQKDWDKVDNDLSPENEILKPLVTHHCADRFKQKESNSRKILYTHKSQDGKKTVIDFTRYPKAWRYLCSHQKKLASREYLTSSGRNWYEIWVPQDPLLWSKPKIVFRDICETPTFWLDLSGAIVNGDCYWFTLNNDMDSENIWIVLAVANSSFIERFYDYKFNNKLYAGRRRFMTQYVNEFPLPRISAKKREKIIKLAKKIYKTKPDLTNELELTLDHLVWSAFGVSITN